MIKIKLMLLAILSLIILPAYPIMMTSTKMAYVDIERIFNEMKEVYKSKGDLKKLIEERKQKIEDIERAIASVRNKISESNVAFGNEQAPQEQVPQVQTPEEKQESQEQVPDGEQKLQEQAAEEGNVTEETLPPSEDIPAREVQQRKGLYPPSEVEEFEKILAEKEKELKKLMEESKKFIQGKEKEFKYKILGQIYETVQSIAMEKGFSVIIDKEVILFSEETVVDMTDDVIRSLNEEYR